MLTAGKWVASIMGGGIALGAMLGAAADPRIKDPPPQWWQLTGRDAIVASSDQVFYDAGPGDLSPYGGYRPDLDYDAEVWALPLPEYELPAFTYEYVEPELPSVTYGVTGDAAAEAAGAEHAASKALAAQTAETPPAEVRKAELALNGIY